MREIRAEYGAARIRANQRAAGLTRGVVAALVKDLIGHPVADPTTATRLAPVLAWFVPDGFELRLATSCENYAGALVELKVSKGKLPFFAQIQRDGSVVGTIARELRLRDREVRHNRFVIEDQWTGQGIGPQFLRDAQQLYEQLEIKRITLTAGGSVGGALWAKAGFSVAASDRERVELQLLDLLEPLGRADVLKSDWKSWDITTIESVNGAQVSIRDVAVMVAGGGGPDIDLTFGPIADHRVDLDRPRRLGESLMLMVAPWSGRLDFDDSTAMALYQEYIAK